MKKKILLSIILVLTLMLSLLSCIRGEKAVARLEVIEGLKTEYELNEKPDFSGVRVLAIYNDETTKEVGADELTFSQLDTSLAGEKKITITYEGVSLDVRVTVKGKSIEEAPVLTGIQYQSGLPSEIFTTTNDIDTITLKVLATYSDGSRGLIDSSKLSTNISELDFSTPGQKTVVIKYQNFSCEYVIEVKAPEIIGIEVDADSIDTVVEAGGTLDISNIKVYAVYNNDYRPLISNTDPKLDLVSGMPNLTLEGEKEYVITYDGKFSCTLIISTTPPELTGIELNTNYTPKTILLGDTLSTAAVIANAKFSNNTGKLIPNSQLTFDYDVSKAGNATVTVSYTHNGITKSASYTVSVLSIASIEIDTESVSSKVAVDQQLDVSNIVLIITDSNGGIHEISRSNEIELDLSGLDTSVLGKGYINASYRGVTSSNLYVTVYDPDSEYIITGVELPQSLINWNSTVGNNMKSFFKKNNSPYLVGDDNPFIFTLTLSGYTLDGIKADSITNYTSASKVYLDGVELTGSELAKYVSIDESKNAFDFTEAAVGKSFKIETRPAHGVDGYEDDFTRVLNVTVVDGYNIYKAYELNFITNWSDFDFSEANVFPGEKRTQVEIVRDFLINEVKVEIPTIGSAIILHNDLYVTPADLPKEYFLGADRKAELFDRINVFSHMTTVENPSFTIYGNYFTVCSNALPVVCLNGNNDDAVSNAQLFGFSVDPAIMDAAGPLTFDHTKYTTTLKDVRFRDDHPNVDEPENSSRDMRGLIGIKTWGQVINFENTRFDRFYISYLADSDYQTVNINDTIFYNSWQNHLFVWSDNPFYLDSDTSSFEHPNYPVLTVNLNNTDLTKAGGPVIISQTNAPKLDVSKYCGAIVNFNTTNYELWTYVTGEEAWFGAVGAGQVAELIKNFNTLLMGVSGGSYVHSDPIPELSDGSFMNILYVNLEAGMDLSVSTSSFVDLDGKLSINGTPLADLTDSAYGGYTDPLVSIIKGVAPNAPVFVSSEGGIGIINQTASGFEMVGGVYNFLKLASGKSAMEICGMLGVQMPDEATAQATLNALDDANKVKLGYGRFITIYHNNMSILLEYNIKNPERYTVPAN